MIVITPKIEKVEGTYHEIINEVVEYLKTKYNPHIMNIEDYNTPFKISDHEIYFKDCELLIYQPEVDIFKGFSFSDYHSSMMSLFIKRNSPKDLILVSQNKQTPVGTGDYNFKRKPFTYNTCKPYIDIDYYYNLRQTLDTFIDKIFFRGNVDLMGRTSIYSLLKDPNFHGGHSVSLKSYFDELIKYKIGLSIPGIGELCYRDMEYLGCGIPMMKYEYLTQMSPKLIPNYHYISIDRIDKSDNPRISIVNERNGGPEYVKGYVERFLEVKDDLDFLSFISYNGRKYYEEYLHKTTRLNNIIKLLEISTV